MHVKLISRIKSSLHMETPQSPIHAQSCNPTPYRGPLAYLEFRLSRISRLSRLAELLLQLAELLPGARHLLLQFLLPASHRVQLVLQRVVAGLQGLRGAGRVMRLVCFESFVQ